MFLFSQLPVVVSFMRRVDSFGTSPKYQRLASGKLSTWGTSVLESSRKKIYTFCGFLGLEIMLLVFLFSRRGNFNFHRLCSPSTQITETRFPPSGFYYQHVYEFPIPALKILGSSDGAPPLRSRILNRDREITIATHTTADRLPAVKMTALRWSGAMVVVVLVKVKSEVPEVYAILQDLHALVEQEGRCRLNIQVVQETGYKTESEALSALYPTNAMRNLALRMVTTDLLLMLDADIVPNPGMHEHLTQDEDKYQNYLERATKEQQVLVVPVFSMVQDKNIGYRDSLHVLPHAKEELREAWWNGVLECFQCDTHPPAQASTDYNKFTDPAVDFPYTVRYMEGYEPFFIAALDGYPEYDPRFRGYGMNKVSHVYLLAAKGTGFTVIPEGYMVELPHLPSLSQRALSGKDKDPLQQWRIDALYRRFKEEVNGELNVTDISAVSPLHEE